MSNMVLRKPVGDVPKPLSQAANNPPYPTTPTAEQPPPIDTTQQPPAQDGADVQRQKSFHLNKVPGQLRSPDTPHDDDDIDSDSDWDTDGEEDTPEDVPAPLKIGGSGVKHADTGAGAGLPTSLRVGPTDEVLRKSQESLRAEAPAKLTTDLTGASNVSDLSNGSHTPLNSNNPYLKRQATGQPAFGAESSSDIWADGPSPGSYQPNQQGSIGPAELPSEKTPVDQFSNMSLNGPLSPSSSQPGMIPVGSETLARRRTDSTVTTDSRHPSNASSVYEPGMDISSLDAFSSRTQGLETVGEEASDHPQFRTWQEQQAWEARERDRKQAELAAAHQRALKAEQERMAEEEWQRGEEQARLAASSVMPQEEQAPQLPPRRSQEEHAPPQPPRPVVSVPGFAGSTRPEVETPGTKAKRQRKEHYQIKHIHWYDHKKGGLRPSPILTQNANGPCPLLALVNGLVLSTPYGEETALVETLRTREQVSLGLLLDAVFDELMSGRRGDAAQELPDVGELYAFLLALHTGMNVNPRFVAPSDEVESLIDVDPSVHPALRGQKRPGGFEQTKEMRLYSTFNIPLIHGWLPPAESSAYAAFDRTAKTYEEAQNVQFLEEGLDAKLRSEGLTAQEQQLFEDVHTIKGFLGRWPTQLTDYGLGVLASLEPGQFAILFRNDHFSTLYKEPRSGQLLTLMTDAGYSSHEEIIWESLVDVSGRLAEMYSGDFRPVSHNVPDAGPAGPRTSSSGQRVQSLLDVGDEGWTTVQGRKPKGQRASGPQTSSTGISGTQESGVIGGSANTTDSSAPDASSNNTEQEDHDLALALQLQEEEEDRARRETEERRRRENELSQQFLEREQTTDGRPSERPTVPPRRNNQPTPQIRTSSARHNDDEAPPPTYEQARAGRPYNPPPDHPASPNAPFGSAYAQQSAMNNGAPIPAGGMPRPQRRRTGSRQEPLINQIPSNQGMGRGAMGGRRASGGPSTPGLVPPGQMRDDREEKCVVM